MSITSGRFEAKERTNTLFGALVVLRTSAFSIRSFCEACTTSEYIITASIMATKKCDLTNIKGIEPNICMMTMVSGSEIMQAME
jgi:hypothetical protein